MIYDGRVCSAEGETMLTMKRMIAQAMMDKLASKGAELSVSDLERMLEYPPDAKMGDLALPCFKLSKILRNAPVKIAAELAEGFCVPCVDRAEAVNGYLNIFLSPEYLAGAVLPEVLEKADAYGAPDLGTTPAVRLARRELSILFGTLTPAFSKATL